MPTYDEWIAGDAVAIGRAMMDHLPAADQVARARAVLDVCRSHASAVDPVDRVATIAAAPELWREGHAAFDAVRASTLRAPASEVSRALLYVAEIAAKIIYNASGCPAPFDSDSSWWLAANARDFAIAASDDAVARDIWRALLG